MNNQQSKDNQILCDSVGQCDNDGIGCTPNNNCGEYVPIPHNQTKSNSDEIREALQWRVHTPNLINDIIANMRAGGLGVVKIPLEIFKRLLVELAEIAIEIDDPRLHLIMIRLCLYEESNPLSKEYNPDCYQIMKKEASSYKTATKSAQAEIEFTQDDIISIKTALTKLGISTEVSNDLSNSQIISMVRKMAARIKEGIYSNISDKSRIKELEQQIKKMHRCHPDYMPEDADS